VGAGERADGQRRHGRLRPVDGAGDERRVQARDAQRSWHGEQRAGQELLRVRAQTRMLTTRPPVEEPCTTPTSTRLRPVCASTRPAGRQASGRAAACATRRAPRSARTSSSRAVTCLAVDGHRAAIGAVGREFRTGIPDGGERRASAILTVVDGRVAANDAHGPHGLGTAQPGSTPPSRPPLRRAAPACASVVVLVQLDLHDLADASRGGVLRHVGVVAADRDAVGLGQLAGCELRLLTVGAHLDERAR
jgi:hypothetical protein